ncbi:hypothetical protein GCM10027425_19760 [Alteromonas gracilis]
MTTSPASTTGRTPAGVLEGVRSTRAVRDAAEIDLLLSALEWAHLHPAPVDEAASFRVAGMGPLPIAGPGAPEIAEDAVPEFALALGVATESGQALLGHALELHHRLPRLMARVVAGDLPVWRARRIAAATLLLTSEAADHVDRHLAPFAHRLGPTAVDRLVEDAIARFMPAEAAERARRAADGRHLTIEHHQVSLDGTSQIHGVLDLADALDLDSALSAGAARLADLGCEESLDVRRSLAAGDLARRQLALDLEASTETDRATVPSRPEARPSRQVVLHVHLSQDALMSPACGDLAGVEAGARLVTAEQVRRWCATADAHVTVRPVIDLNADPVVSSYVVPERIAEHVRLRDRTCVFPHCTRPARRCDLDHRIPHDRGGPTSPSNLAPLCRRHHRLKTHTAWHYDAIAPGTYRWTSPLGHQWRRDPDGGTTDLEPIPPPLTGRPAR